MNKTNLIKHLFLGILFLTNFLYAQEGREDDLGDVSDVFQENFYEGITQFSIEKYDKAVNAFLICKSEQPDNSTIYFELGKAYLKLKEFQLAQIALEKATKIDAKNEWFLDALYEVYEVTHQDDKAIETLNKLVVFHEDYKEDLAKFYFERSDYDNALRLINELEDSQGITSERDRLREIIFQRNNNSEQRIAFYKKRIVQFPEVEKNYMSLMLEYAKQNKKQEILDLAETLKKKGKDSPKTHMALFRFYVEENDYENASKGIISIVKSNEIGLLVKENILNDFLSIANKNPEQDEKTNIILESFKGNQNNYKLFRIISDYQLSKGNNQAAIDALEHVNSDGMTDVISVKNQIILLLKNEQFKTVIEKATAALELYPAQAELYLFNAIAHNKENKPLEAISFSKNGLDYIIDNPILESDLYKEIGYAYRALNDEKNYKKYLLKAKEVLENAQ